MPNGASRAAWSFDFTVQYTYWPSLRLGFISFKSICRFTSPLMGAPQLCLTSILVFHTMTACFPRCIRQLTSTGGLLKRVIVHPFKAPVQAGALFLRGDNAFHS